VKQEKQQPGKNKFISWNSPAPSTPDCTQSKLAARLRLKTERDAAAKKDALETSTRALEVQTRKQADIERRMVQAKEAVEASEKAAEAKRQDEVTASSRKKGRWQEVIGQWNNVRGELSQSKRDKPATPQLPKTAMPVVTPARPAEHSRLKERLEDAVSVGSAAQAKVLELRAALDSRTEHEAALREDLKKEKEHSAREGRQRGLILVSHLHHFHRRSLRGMSRILTRQKHSMIQRGFSQWHRGASQATAAQTASETCLWKVQSTALSRLGRSLHGMSQHRIRLQLGWWLSAAKIDAEERRWARTIQRAEENHAHVEGSGMQTLAMKREAEATVGHLRCVERGMAVMKHRGEQNQHTSTEVSTLEEQCRQHSEALASSSQCCRELKDQRCAIEKRMVRCQDSYDSAKEQLASLAAKNTALEERCVCQSDKCAVAEACCGVEEKKNAELTERCCRLEREGKEMRQQMACLGQHNQLQQSFEQLGVERDALLAQLRMAQQKALERFLGGHSTTRRRSISTWWQAANKCAARLTATMFERNTLLQEEKAATEVKCGNWQQKCVAAEAEVRALEDQNAALVKKWATVEQERLRAESRSPMRHSLPRSPASTRNPLFNNVTQRSPPEQEDRCVKKRRVEKVPSHSTVATGSKASQRLQDLKSRVEQYECEEKAEAKKRTKRHAAQRLTAIFLGAAARRLSLLAMVEAAAATQAALRCKLAARAVAGMSVAAKEEAGLRLRAGVEGRRARSETAKEIARHAAAARLQATIRRRPLIRWTQDQLQTEQQSAAVRIFGALLGRKFRRRVRWTRTFAEMGAAERVQGAVRVRLGREAVETLFDWAIHLELEGAIRAGQAKAAVAIQAGVRGKLGRVVAEERLREQERKTDLSAAEYLSTLLNGKKADGSGMIPERHSYIFVPALSKIMDKVHKVAAATPREPGVQRIIQSEEAKEEVATPVVQPAPQPLCESPSAAHLKRVQASRHSRRDTAKPVHNAGIDRVVASDRAVPATSNLKVASENAKARLGGRHRATTGGRHSGRGITGTSHAA